MSNGWTWYEMMTVDAAAAAEFYTKLLGLKAEAWPDPAMQYTILSSASGGVGGVAALPDEAKVAGAPPHWLGVVGVADAASIAERAVAGGGAVIAPPMALPGVGVYAMLADPTGAVFAVLQPEPGEQPPTPSKEEMGRVSWNELWSSDPDRAWAFYSELFGWVETGTMDMGPGGLYRMYSNTAGGQSLGGIAMKQPEQPVSAWMFYFNVEAVEASIAQAGELGGRLLMGPHPVPGGRFAILVDPQGAAFSVYTHGEA